MKDLTELANRMADEAGEIIRKYYRASFSSEHKADRTSVTEADRAVEKRLREMIESERPHDGVIGEEYGIKESENGLNWVLDPIDGTTSFIAGRPTFGTLIGLWEGDDNALLGIIDQPVSKERWLGVKGQETQLNGQGTRTRICGNLAEARIASTSASQLSQGSPPLWQRLQESCDFFLWGGDCYGYGLVAHGGLDAVVETGLATYDYAALVPVIAGAGGWIGDWSGNPLKLSSGGEVLALGDQSLLAQISEILS